MKGFNHILILFIILFSFGKAIHGQNLTFQNLGEEKVSLNGSWSFSTDTDIAKNNNWIKPNFPIKNWDNLLIPGNWDTENKYAHFVGTAYYRKAFSVPSSWKQSSVILAFDAVYQKASVWINGIYLGEHVGGYTPFRFDISKYVHYDRENIIALTANNEYGRGAWWHWGGISGDVNLVRHNKQYIVLQHITAEPNLQDGSAHLSIKIKIKNSSNKEFQGLLNANVINLQNGYDIGLLSKHSISIEPNSEKTEHLKFKIQPEDVQIWDVTSPNLYKLYTRLQTSDSLIHKKEDRFGIRKVETNGSSLLLNGKKVNFKGFNRIADHRAYGQTEPDELVKFDIDAMKSMGCDFTRINHHPQSKTVLDYCDEVGMLLIQEIPVWQDDPHLYPDNLEAKTWFEELIDRDYNHPSVIGWSVGNEIHDGTLEGRQMSPRVYGYVESMINHVKKIDSTRLTTYVSFTVGKATGLGMDPADVCDIISFTSYGDASKVAKRVHEVWPNKPIFVAEIGLKQFDKNPSKASLPSNLIRSIQNTQALDYVCGISLWTYNDYRSTYKGTPPAEARTWGVYNVWRQPKPAAYEIQKIFVPNKKHKELPVLTNTIPEIAENKPTILTVVPLENSCMIGYTVLDKEDNYEIEYKKENNTSKTVKVVGLKGAAKVYDLEPGNYDFRIRAIKNDHVGEWSSVFKANINSKED